MGWVRPRTPRSTLAVTTLVAALALLVACGDEREVPTATAQPAQPPVISSPLPTAPVTTPTPTPEPRFDDVVASTARLPIEALDRVEFTSGDALAVLSIEVPPSREYGVGLSGRYELVDRGMLFYYPEGHRGAFWMKNTHFDLDIAFVDPELRIIAIIRMEAESEMLHRPDDLYIAAIEAPAGWYDATSIGVGADVRFLFDVDAVTTAANAE